MTTEEKKQALEGIIAEMQTAFTYELAKHANLVPGEGNPDAQVMFIGEAPGADEDRLQRPFVGRSGQLLRAQIRAIGWKEEDVFITNVVKHRPPQNRDPLPEEISENKIFLNKQIDVIDPDLFVTLGRFSMGKFFPDKKISQIHGKIFRIHWYGRIKYVYPLYHPAAALRSTAMKDQFVKDFQRIPKVVEWIEAHREDDVLEDTIQNTLL